jgi:Domain of unknown function (DUF4398)
MNDLYALCRHLTTQVSSAAPNGLANPRFVLIGKHNSRLGSIHFLTDFQDFSTVHSVSPRRQSWALALGFLLFSGCGPVVYLKEVSTRTAAALSQAKADGAEKHAPYEFKKADLYYEKAREDAGRAHFQDAIDWGRRSQDCSRRASALAKSGQAKHTDDAPRPSQSCGEL